MRKRLIPFFVLLFSFMLVAQVSAAPVERFPEVIPLPNGFQPEGIVAGRGTAVYAGSLANGAIYKADLGSGEGHIFIDGQEGTMAVGLAYDDRTDNLFVAGGAFGAARVYDAISGDLLAAYQLADPTSGPFINDVIVTHDAAYFTNSFAAEYYRVPLGRGGAVDANATVETIPLTGDFVQVDGFNSNGIEASANGRYLLIINSGTATLYRVEAHTGDAVAIDLDFTPSNGDGLVLRGNTLYIVQNFLNQIAVVKLHGHYTSGTLQEILTDDDFRIPTTATLFGRRLYAVNARFDTTPTADTEYEIVQVDR